MCIYEAQSFSLGPRLNYIISWKVKTVTSDAPPAIAIIVGAAVAGVLVIAAIGGYIARNRAQSAASRTIVRGGRMVRNAAYQMAAPPPKRSKKGGGGASRKGSKK
jgi:hypothetical protein